MMRRDLSPPQCNRVNQCFLPCLDKEKIITKFELKDLMKSCHNSTFQTTYYPPILPNQSEVCFRALSCVLTRICTRSSVARLVCLGRATELCSRWKGSVSAYNVGEIDQIVRENLTRNYTEYFRWYHRRTYLKVCEVRIKRNGCRR